MTRIKVGVNTGGCVYRQMPNSLVEKICTPTSACNEKFIRTPKLCSPRKVRQRFVYRILLSFYASFSVINRSLFVCLLT